MRYRKILVPTDLSLAGKWAALEALEHLKPGGELRLVHVCQPEFVVTLYADGNLPLYDPRLTRLKLARATAQVAREAKALGPRVKPKVISAANPAVALVAEALRFKAQVLVLSTHGRSGWDRFMFGSVAQKILRLYDGPVLMLRPAQRSLKVPGFTT